SDAFELLPGSAAVEQLGGFVVPGLKTGAIGKIKQMGGQLDAALAQVQRCLRPALQHSQQVERLLHRTDAKADRSRAVGQDAANRDAAGLTHAREQRSEVVTFR